MAEEIDDAGFYREDFSTESEWEVFNAELCEIFHKWELANTDWGRALEEGELFRCSWDVQSEHLKLRDKEVSVTFYVAKLKCVELAKSNNTIPPLHSDLLSLGNTFGPFLVDGQEEGLRLLARLYGLRRFVVIQPRHPRTRYISNPAEFMLFLSAATVVAAEVCAAVPIFVQIYDPKWNYFLGVGMAPSMRTTFDLVALEHAPQEYCYLSGLLKMFKEKLPRSHVQPAIVSVRNTYALDTVNVRIPMYVPFGMTPAVDEERSVISVSHFTALPHGFFPNSCTKMYAIYTWPEIAENIAIDSALQSHFVPSKAPYGCIRQVVQATSYLSSCLRDYSKLREVVQSLESYVGRNFSGTSSLAEVANPLDKLTKPQVRLHASPQGHSYAASASVAARKIPGPLNENELNQMLLFLFPNLHPEAALFPYTKSSSRQKFDPHRVKSAAADSLVSRLSCLLATCYSHFGGKSGLAQLWAAFTRELRFLWDNCCTVPGVAAGFPDTRTCLLHQKLQMLNVCVERRKLRESGSHDQKLGEEVASTSLISDDEDEEEGEKGPEEEFYDCTDDGPELLDSQSRQPTTQSPTDEPIPRPEGRLKQLGDLKLLDSDEPLYIPITQEPVPKTEDQLHDDAEVMLQLGPGSDLTTQMMCPSLLSDMEAFKAANPKATMEDFIRWYSPKDWVETVDENERRSGELSARMSVVGNTWHLVWQQACPVPVARQKRLFDDTNEAFKVLNYLETRTIGEIYQLTIVPLLHAALLKLKDIFSNCKVSDLFSESMDEILADLSHMARDIEFTAHKEAGFVAHLPSAEPILRKIEALEAQFYQYKCFERTAGYPHCTQLDEVKSQFREILKSGGTCDILTGRGEGKKGRGMLNPSFKNEMRDSLLSKDYVIRGGEGLATMAANETSDKAPTMPQFLRAIVTGEKLRLCGAFTENITLLD